MKSIIKYLLLSLLIPLELASQNIGNEWINLNQSYFRLSIPKTGIYKVTRQQLLDAGVPLSSNDFSPQKIQLFLKGNEIPCYIKEGSPGQIDYILFYAEKNDGEFDLDMYDNPDNQTNPNYSLINDTASVFLTANDNINNLRYTLESDVNFQGYTPENYCMSTVCGEYTNTYYPGVEDCEYVRAEGWFDNVVLDLGKTITKTIATPDFKNVNQTTTYNIAYISFSKDFHPHHINTTGPGFVHDTIFGGYQSIHITKNVQPANLDAETTITLSNINDQNNTATSKIAMSYIQIKYPRGFNANCDKKFNFLLPPSIDKKQYVEIEGFTCEGNPVLFDITNSKIIPVVNDNNTLKTLIPASSNEKNLFLIDENYYNSPTSITQSNFVNHASKDNDYIIITNRKLWESAKAYAAYRNAYLVDVDELYNQFGYGIQKHPMAIRNFMHYVFNNWQRPPSYLLLLGKSVQAIDTRTNPAVYSNCLVPTMGQFGSDDLLSTRIIGNGYAPALATGRIAAQNNNEVDIYLNKLQEFEQNKADEWMKRAIHFGGGSTAGEQQDFKRYLANYEAIFEDTLFGGSVTTFLKTTSGLEEKETSRADSVQNLINSGISLITFFGHGSVTLGYEGYIDEPSAFKNGGKYPFILANSCYSGNIHLNGKASKSEDWILIKDKGAIGFLAMVGHGEPIKLDYFSDRFYKNLSSLDYGESLGKNIVETKQWVEENKFDVKSTLQEFTLHGDPAIVLNSFSFPDLKVNQSEISFIPANITTQIDSFYMVITATNQAKTTNSSFVVEIKRKFQNDSTTSYSYKLQGLKYKKAYKLKLPVDKINGLGNNMFTVLIDANNDVEELDEINNTTTINTFIAAADVVPVLPYKYGLKKLDDFVLKGSSIDAFAGEQTSVFQIDTSYLFNSPFLISENIQHTGGIIQWMPDIDYKLGETYFWRVAKNDDNKNWMQSSFGIDMVKTGWRQADYGQLRDNELSFLNKSDKNRSFDFEDAQKTIVCKNIGSPQITNEYTSIYFDIDGITGVSSCGAIGAMIVVVIDSTTLLPWPSNKFPIGEVGHNNDPWCSGKGQENYFIFYSTTENMQKLAEFIGNKVPDGDYILIYSFMNGNFQNYNTYTTDVFKSLGAYQIEGTNNNIPYIFFTKKGDLSTAEEVIGNTTTARIEFSRNLKYKFAYGLMNSPTIGPALSWKQVNWKSHKEEDNPNEVAFLRVYGINNTGKDTLIADSIIDESYNLFNISTQQYPYLKLQFYTSDATYRTPSILDSWEVVYQPVTDIAINPQKELEFYNDTLQQGEKGKVSIAIENIGKNDADSTHVAYWLQNDKNENIPIWEHNLAPLKPGQSVVDTLSFSTLSKQGEHSFWMEVNPQSHDSQGIGYREQYYFNNLAYKRFYIQPDSTNPVLDVTFNGQHIMDGDLVSAQPEIVIQLSDENRYIPLNDTSLFSVYIKSHQTGIENKIAIGSNPNVEFIPAKLPENKAKILYNPRFSNDGVYELRVQARDINGNESGIYDYNISFQIINESTITNVFNYPNPFSTSTRFVFELTGSEVPDQMQIEIITVTGRIVKVIYLEDLEPLHIGKNVTQYFWDGTDMYGDPLANGVYFYKVDARLNGKKIKVRDNGTNQYFKNGFGKMYLMR